MAAILKLENQVRVTATCRDWRRFSSEYRSAERAGCNQGLLSTQDAIILADGPHCRGDMDEPLGGCQTGCQPLSPVYPVSTTQGTSHPETPPTPEATPGGH